MGYVKIKAKISNIEKTKGKEIELLADTGVIYTAIPKKYFEFSKATGSSNYGHFDINLEEKLKKIFTL